MEAYAELYKIWPDPLVKERLQALLLIFLDRIIRDSGHLGIFFDNAFREPRPPKVFAPLGTTSKPPGCCGKPPKYWVRRQLLSGCGQFA